VLNLVNPRAIRALGGLQLILLGALISCGGGGPSQPVAAPPTGGGTVEPPPQGLLVALESPDAFKQKITAGFTTASSERAIAVGDGAVSSDGLDGGSDGGTLDVTSEGAAGDAAGGTETVSFTTTYTLETNVDEYDVVKYNGSQLFIAPSRGMDCCVVFEDEVAFDGLDRTVVQMPVV